jgi:hypothetical protein
MQQGFAKDTILNIIYEKSMVEIVGFTSMWVCSISFSIVVGE